MSLEGLKIQRGIGEFFRLPEGPQVMQLESADLTERNAWDNATNSPSETEKETVLRFAFSKSVEGNEAKCFCDCTLKFGEKAKLPKVLKGLFGASGWDEVRGSDEAIQSAIQGAIGSYFLVTHEYKESKAGNPRNSFVSVSVAPKEMVQSYLNAADDDIPF